MSSTVVTSELEMSQALERNGFLIVPNLYSKDEVRVFKEEIARVLDAVKSEAQREAELLAKTGVYVGIAGKSALFREAVRDPRLVDILETAMGPNIEFISDKIVYKNGATSYASPWHQDYPYWEGCHKWSVWVALDDATIENGTLRVIPGTHKTRMEHHDPGGVAFTNRVHDEDIDESQAVTAQVEAGGAVFFHDLTVHGSHESTVLEDRWVWIPTFRDAVEGKSDPHYPWILAPDVVRGTME